MLLPLRADVLNLILSNQTEYRSAKIFCACTQQDITSVVTNISVFLGLFIFFVIFITFPASLEMIDIQYMVKKANSDYFDRDIE